MLSNYIVPFVLVYCLLSSQDDWSGLASKAQQAEKSGNYREAKKLLDSAIKLEAARPELYSMRGAVHFKLALIKESLADFDQQIRLRSSDASAHWRRGLTLYYAEKYPEGVDQFSTSDAAEPDDVENAVWHMLCNAKVKGVEAARKELLKVKQDSRIPMMEVYALFAGKSTVEKVLAKAEAGQADTADRKMRRFYAHLYAGLYEEMMGQKKKSLELVSKAAKEYPIEHYMNDVARVHVALRK